MPPTLSQPAGYVRAMRLSVSYPLRAGRLVLRTALDWDRDVLPAWESPTTAVFDVSPEETTLALKPCLRDGDALHWARGPDYVLSENEPDPHLYPYFFSETRGHVSDVLHVGAGDTSHAVRVYHPAGYEENPLRRFPVVYMHDGNNLFFPEEAFRGNEWQVDETMDRLDEMNAIRKAIVVGVAPGDRMREYTHPGYEAYGWFMVQRLKPLVDQHLRTLPGPADTVVMGSSLGGVASLHLAWAHPTVFGKAACLSSTFGYRDDLFVRIAAEPKRDILVYLDSGFPGDNYDATNAMRNLLVSRGFRLGTDLLHFCFPDARHEERAWAVRAHLPFQFFLGRAWRAQRGEG